MNSSGFGLNASIYPIRGLFILITVLGSLSVSFYAQAQVNASDSLALLTLYDSTNGDHWNNNDNWKIGAVSTWFGIDVENGVIRAINLRDNNLEGTIPPQLGDIITLEAIQLSNNQLSSSVPGELGNIQRMNGFDVSNNRMEGTLPMSLGNWSSLQLLLLNDNDFSGTIPAGMFSGQLAPGFGGNRALVVNNNNFVNLPDFSQVENMVLFLENNQFTFEDIELQLPLLNEPNTFLNYSPQQPVYDSLVLTAREGANLRLESLINGSANTYEWYKDSILVEGQTSATLLLNDLSLGDQGTYYALIRSDVVDDLVIRRSPVHLSIAEGSNEIDFCGEIVLTAPVEDPLATYRWDSGEADQNITITGSGRYVIVAETENYVISDTIQADLRPSLIQPFLDIDIIAGSRDAVTSIQDTLLIRAAYSFETRGTDINVSGWDFGDGNTSPDDIATHRFTSPGNFIITLGFTDQEQCVGQVSRTFQVSDLTITNAVTPNGDGDNDKMYVIPGHFPFQLTLLNRWGQEIYQGDSDQMDWEPLSAGIYFYELLLPVLEEEYTGTVVLLKK